MLGSGHWRVWTTSILMPKHRARARAPSLNGAFGCLDTRHNARPVRGKRIWVGRYKSRSLDLEPSRKFAFEMSSSSLLSPLLFGPEITIHDSIFATGYPSLWTIHLLLFISSRVHCFQWSKKVQWCPGCYRCLLWIFMILRRVIVFSLPVWDSFSVEFQ